MAKRSSSGTAVAVRIAALLVVGAIALFLVMLMRSPMVIPEAQVREMLATNELVNLPLEEAAARLQHRPPDPPVIDGIVLFDFHHIRGWQAPAVEVEVRGGRVASARWHRPELEGFR